MATMVNTGGGGKGDSVSVLDNRLVALDGYDIRNAIYLNYIDKDTHAYDVEHPPKMFIPSNDGASAYIIEENGTFTKCDNYDQTPQANFKYFIYSTAPGSTVAQYSAYCMNGNYYWRMFSSGDVIYNVFIQPGGSAVPGTNNWYVAVTRESYNYRTGERLSYYRNNQFCSILSVSDYQYNLFYVDYNFAYYCTPGFSTNTDAFYEFDLENQTYKYFTYNTSTGAYTDGGYGYTNTQMKKIRNIWLTYVAAGKTPIDLYIKVPDSDGTSYRYFTRNGFEMTSNTGTKFPVFSASIGFTEGDYLPPLARSAYTTFAKPWGTNLPFLWYKGDIYKITARALPPSLPVSYWVAQKLKFNYSPASGDTLATLDTNRSNWLVIESENSSSETAVVMPLKDTYFTGYTYYFADDTSNSNLCSMLFIRKGDIMTFDKLGIQELD